MNEWSGELDRDQRPEPKPVPKRFGVPRDANVLIIVLAIIAGAAIIASTTISVVALVRITHQQEEAQENRSQSSRSICDALNGNARANNNLTDFLGVILEVSAAERHRPGSAQPLIDELAKRKVPVLPCDDFVQSILTNSKPPKSADPPPPPDLDELRRRLKQQQGVTQQRPG